MGKINREDMLELTRRMTLKRNCFDRIAGWIVVAVLYRKRCGDAQGINYGLEQLHIVVALKGSLDILKP